MNTIILIILALVLAISPGEPASLPETGRPVPAPLDLFVDLPDGVETGRGTSTAWVDENHEHARLRAWIAGLPEGDPDTVISVFVPDILAQPVVPQRSSLDVTIDPQEISQFRLAQTYGSIGLLAHNYLIGAKFFEIEVGDRAYAIYGDGHYDVYQVTEIADYQAINLYVYRDLITNARLDQYALVDKIYGAKNDRLVFQTCIEKDGALSWGRRFVLAQLVEEMLAPEAVYFPPNIVRQPR